MIDSHFATYKKLAPPRLTKIISIGLFFFVVTLALALVIIPWQQSTQAHGTVVALDPNERIQEINTFVSGRITHWFVQDGSPVKKDDPIVEIIDNDPNLVNRLIKETQAKKTKVQVSKSAAETGLRDLNRQKELYEKGLSSRKVYEKADIEYQKLLSEVAMAEVELAKAETSLSRQEVRVITSPTDGTILKVISGSQSLIVKEGQPVATILPKSQRQAIEVFVSGNDLPLVTVGRKARIQFEGWPAVQFIGWPDLAIGTFPGKVLFVDPSTKENGMFRVVIGPDENSRAKWPTSDSLRQGNRAYAWVLLETVQLGYEIWRQFNGFPLTSISEKKSKK